ncbi:MAG: DNA methyltransferase [Myxococcota bacterium]|jgi:type II restriction/modification system DNA methylase subunit YeeA
MTPHEFVQKWKANNLTERASAQEHFIDLCRLFDHPTPTEADRTGKEYAFEKGVTKTGGGDGFADVWKRGFFAWEYKKRKRNLDQALEQLTRYASALENPPLHVACDTEHFKIVTAWTNTIPKTYTLSLEDLLDTDKRAILHAVFHDPATLKPQRTRASLTEEAAKRFSTIVERLQHRHADREAIAHFVNQLVFCFFAEDVKLLPEDYFTKLLRSASRRPDRAKEMLDGLFGAMEKGGFHGVEDIAHFNGGLFDGRRALELRHGEIDLLVALGSMEWDQIDPTIFGTLFERFLDPDKRAQIGAHYTDPEKIMMIVNPVVVYPLLSEWESVKARINGLLDGAIKPPKSARSGKIFKPLDAAEGERAAFLDRLRAVRILDPACGSGNFLYLALHAVKDIENRVVLETEALGLSPQALLVGPEIVMGIELNPLAAELARTTIWIGYIQWKIRNAIYAKDDPILRKLGNIECRDALLTSLSDTDGSEKYVEANWPKAEFIVGNPPFLGSRKLQPELGAEYVKRLRAVYGAWVPDGADLVTFWFYKGGEALSREADRLGFVATNSIVNGKNRAVLADVAAKGRIFRAWSDEPWSIDGASVRVSIICISKSNIINDTILDGKNVDFIFPDLTARRDGVGVDLTQAVKLAENKDIAFQGVVPRGRLNRKDADLLGLPPGTFLLDREKAVEMLAAVGNPNGRNNKDVVVPYLIGEEIVQRPQTRYVVDFFDRSELEASLYQEPFRFILPVKAHRAHMNQKEALETWWKHWNSRPAMRKALTGTDRYLATPRVSKYRVFRWVSSAVLADNMIVAIAKDDDITFGILQSRYHEIWSLRMCSYLGVGNDPRYTPSTTFETFPFPEGLTPDLKVVDLDENSTSGAVANAARELNISRERWLNPPELTTQEFDFEKGMPLDVTAVDLNASLELKRRTLTNLYNDQPAWLRALHRNLDEAVAMAYGWEPGIGDDEAIAELLALNETRNGKQQ